MSEVSGVKLICSGSVGAYGEAARRSRWTTGGDSCTPHAQNCGDAEGRQRPGRESPVQAHHPCARESRRTKGKALSVPNLRVGKAAYLPPRKAAIAACGPVPQTDTGRRVEKTMAGGRSIVKELGKMTP